MTDLIRDAVNAIGGLLHRHHKELVNVMRQPTPLNVTVTVQANAAGVIGGGFTAPSPITLWQCPVSTEGWLNRIGLLSPSGTPGTPLTTGQMLMTGSTAGELIMFYPLAGIVAPTLVTEGRLSAAQLNPGEQVLLIGDGLPANAYFTFYFQVVMVQGVSDYTPKIMENIVDIMP